MEGRGEVAGEIPADHCLVGVRDQPAELPGERLRGDVPQLVRGRLEQGWSAAPRHRRRRVNSWTFSGAMSPSQSSPSAPYGATPATDAAARQRPGQQRSAGQRVRAAAGPARGDEGPGAQVVKDRGDVGGRVRDQPAGLLGGPRRSRAGRTARSAGRGRSRRRSSGCRRRGRRECRMEHERQAVRGAEGQYLQRPAVLGRDGEPFSCHGPRVAGPPCADRTWAGGQAARASC